MVSNEGQNPDAANDSWSHFHFKCPLPAPAWSSVVPFAHKELNFAGHGSPVQLIKANYS